MLIVSTSCICGAFYGTFSWLKTYPVVQAPSLEQFHDISLSESNIRANSIYDFQNQIQTLYSFFWGENQIEHESDDVPSKMHTHTCTCIEWICATIDSILLQVSMRSCLGKEGLWNDLSLSRSAKVLSNLRTFHMKGQGLLPGKGLAQCYKCAYLCIFMHIGAARVTTLMYCI